MYSKEKKKIFGAHHLRSEDNIEVDFEELDLGGGGWIDLIWHRIRTSCELF